MNDFGELRDSLRADQKSGIPFWVPVIVIVAIGALGGLLSAAIAPEPQPTFRHISANLDKPVIESVPASTGLPEKGNDESAKLLNDDTLKEMSKYSKDKLFVKRAKMMERYHTTVSQAQSCSNYSNTSQTRQIVANYKSKNAKNYQAWVDGRKKSKFERKIENGEVTQADAVKAALTGELRNAATGSVMENMAMLSGMTGSSLTTNQCSKLRADMQMGVLDIPPPPKK